MLASCKKTNGNYPTHDLEAAINKIDTSTSDIESKTKKLDTLYQTLIMQSNNAQNRNLLFKVAGLYYGLDAHEKYLNTTKILYDLAQRQKDTAHMARSLYFIGDHYEMKIQIDSAFKYYSKSEKLYRKTKDTLNRGRTLLYKAGTLYDAGIFAESEIQTAQALHLLTIANNHRLVYECYNLMGLNLKELNDFKGALKYFNLALDQLDIMEQADYNKDKLIRSHASIYNNMGSLYSKMKNFKKATEYYNLGLKSANLKSNHPILYAMLLNNLAEARLALGSNDNLIENQMLQSLEIREKNHFEAGTVNSKISLAEFYFHKKDTVKGKKYALEGYNLAKKIESSYDIKNALKLLSENDSKQSKHYGNLYRKVSDSIYNLERKTKNKFARIAYETNQIQKDNRLLTNRNRNITLVAVIAILILATLFIIYRLRSRNKELLFIKRQNEANEKIYQLMIASQEEAERVRQSERNRIAMELHDGIVNRIFTSRFNLMQLEASSIERKKELVTELERAEEEIRKVSHDLKNNALFSDSSFQLALGELVAKQSKVSDTSFELTIDKYIDWPGVSSEYKMHLYRIIQEALHNINKYAKAAQSEIMLLRTGNTITVRISDDGIGFDPEKVKYGIGIQNIRQRTALLKGKFNIVTAPNEGTFMEIVF